MANTDTLAAYLAEVATETLPCDWPVFVAASMSLELDDAAFDATLTSVETPVFTESTARRFLDHLCIYTTREKGAELLTIGRSSKCDYRVAHASVSGRHAQLVPGPDGTFSIVDTASRNGTYVETRKLDPGKPVEVPANALVQFGSASFYWIEPEMARTLARVSNPRDTQS